MTDGDFNLDSLEALFKNKPLGIGVGLLGLGVLCGWQLPWAGGLTQVLMVFGGGLFGIGLLIKKRSGR